MKLWGKEAFNPYSHRRMKIKVKKNGMVSLPDCERYLDMLKSDASGYR